MKTLTKHYWLSQSLWGTIIKTNDSVIYVPEVSLENRTTPWQEAKWLSEVTTLLISEVSNPGGLASDETSKRTQKAWLTFADLYHETSVWWTKGEYTA